MAYRASAVISLCCILLAACGETAPAVPGGPFQGTGGTGNTGNTVNTGTGGQGGDAGIGGDMGTGGEVATGGVGGTAATGGMGGSGGIIVPSDCNTNDLCTVCPDRFLCNHNNDCLSLLGVGYACIPSGCTTVGACDQIKQCQPLPGGACMDDDDCPSPSDPSPDYACEVVQGEGNKCVKQTPGCNSDADCIRGFSCEGGACVDRRVPCTLDEECPVNYSCEQTTLSNRFCIRIYEDCESGLDCGQLAPFCEDVDGDGRKECAGQDEVEPSVPCLSSMCEGSAPVCEASGVGSIAGCGQYGLCQDAGDCADGTFACAELWNDGRKECVKSAGSTCSHITDCPVNQVCAASRNGGPAECQRGTMTTPPVCM